MSSDVAIRPARADEAALLAQLHATSFEDHWPEDAIGSLLQRPNVQGYLAMVNGGEAVGFSLIQVIADEAEILTICIVPQHRLRKAGRLLLEASLQGARLSGAQKIFLEVAETNLPARRIYSLAGFEPVGRRKAYYPGGGGLAGSSDALVLRKNLTA